MKVHIEFHTDNAAFADDPGEVSRIMAVAMSKVSQAWGIALAAAPRDIVFDEALLDRNGNTVGSVKVVPSDAIDARRAMWDPS